MLNEELMVSECYICQESCEEKSPCECEAYVHPICLKNFCSISNKNSCTICQTLIVEVTQDLDETDDHSVQTSDDHSVQLSLTTRIFVGFLFYFIMGVLGCTIVQLFNDQQVQIVYAFWSYTFMSTSLITSIGICFVSICLCMVRLVMISILNQCRIRIMVN